MLDGVRGIGALWRAPAKLAAFRCVSPSFARVFAFPVWLIPPSLALCVFSSPLFLRVLVVLLLSPLFFFFPPLLQTSPLLSVSSCAPHPRPPLPSPSHAEAHSRRASNNARVQAHPPTFSALCLLSLSPAWLCAAATKPWGQPMRSLSTGELQA